MGLKLGAIRLLFTAALAAAYQPCLAFQSPAQWTQAGRAAPQVLARFANGKDGGCTRCTRRGDGGLRMAVDPVLTNMVLGAMSGSVSNMAVFPFELAKTRMQNAQTAEEKVKYSNLATSIASITQEKGLPALWTGSLPVLLGGAPESALQLAAHSWMVSSMIALVGAPGTAEGDLPLLCQLLCGCFAGASTLAATNPMEVLRLRAARGDERGLISLGRELGLRGMFEGCEATLLRDIPFSMLYFPLYSSLKSSAGAALDLLHATNLETVSLLIAGFGAGAVASFLTTPCDVIKTRVQSGVRPRGAASSQVPRLVTAFATQDDPPTHTGAARVRAVAVETVKEEGLSALMRGSGVRVLKLAPNMALTLALYETAQRILCGSLAVDAISTGL